MASVHEKLHIASRLSARERWLAICGGAAGNLVEWYDWYAYSSFSLYFAHAFFPSGDRTAELLGTSGIFAVGFLVRPLGGWLLGRYADRSGRKAALTLSVLMMCLGSLAIAVMPTYESIGVAAPMLLTLARLMQGFSLGGEYGTSSTYLSEAAPPGRRGFYSSFQYVTLIGGQLLASAVLLVLQRVLLTPQQLDAWGWRVAFVVGAACALVALELRRRLPETSTVALDPARRQEAGGLGLLLRHRREALVVAGLTLGGTVAFYTYTTYMQTFLVNTAGFSRPQSTILSAATLLFGILLQPLMGTLSDRVGRRPLLMAFGIAGVLGTVPLLSTLAHVHSASAAFALIAAALTAVACYTSISPVVKAELFPAEIRALGVGLPYALTVGVFGGSANYVALWFKSTGHESFFYWYVTLCIGCSLTVYAGMRETLRTSRIDD